MTLSGLRNKSYDRSLKELLAREAPKATWQNLMKSTNSTGTLESPGG
jgi:hypothetical protein